MTHLRYKVSREFSAAHKPKPWIITLYPSGFIGFKEKRGRKEFCIPIELCYYHAVKYQDDLIERRKNVRRKRS